MESSSSVMAPFFANQSCDPFQPIERPCTLGNYVRYAVNATCSDDIIATVNFARETNVRFVIRNTGHDYNGRSTGAGALSIWTHHLKDIDALDWDDEFYTGKAFRVGAGVQGFEALEASSEHGVVVLTGECPSVGIAGGYTQGGGHSALSTIYGLSADNTLSFEVVTAAGELVTADRIQNSDLYWALSGGGGGNFGVVVSMTVKVHPDSIVSAARFSVTTEANNTQDQIFQTTDIWYAHIIDIVDSGVFGVYSVGMGYFQTLGLSAYGKTQDEFEQILTPFLAALEDVGINYTITYDEFSSYYDYYIDYWGPLPVGVVQVGVDQYGGRLVKRDQVNGIGGAMRAIVEKGASFNGVALNVSRFGGPEVNALLPVWRDTIFHSIIFVPWNFSAPWSEDIAVQQLITNELQPLIQDVTPGSGAYMNEADWHQPDFQEVFFGTNYPKLLEIKRARDPTNLFWAVNAVGSEAYVVEQDGRLCEAS